MQPFLFSWWVSRCFDMSEVGESNSLGSGGCRCVGHRFVALRLPPHVVDYALHPSHYRAVRNIVHERIPARNHTASRFSAIITRSCMHRQNCGSRRYTTLATSGRWYSAPVRLLSALKRRPTLAIAFEALVEPVHFVHVIRERGFEGNCR